MPGAPGRRAPQHFLFGGLGMTSLLWVEFAAGTPR